MKICTPLRDYRDPLLRTVGKFTAGDHDIDVIRNPKRYLFDIVYMSIIHVRCPRLIMTEEWCSMMPVNYGRVKEDSTTEIPGYAKTARRKQLYSITSIDP